MSWMGARYRGRVETFYEPLDGSGPTGERSAKHLLCLAEALDGIGGQRDIEEPITTARTNGHHRCPLALAHKSQPGAWGRHVGVPGHEPVPVDIPDITAGHMVSDNMVTERGVGAVSCDDQVRLDAGSALGRNRYAAVVFLD